jgi:hypothetical protein
MICAHVLARSAYSQGARDRQLCTQSPIDRRRELIHPTAPWLPHRQLLKLHVATVDQLQGERDVGELLRERRCSPHWLYDGLADASQADASSPKLSVHDQRPIRNLGPHTPTPDEQVPRRGSRSGIEDPATETWRTRTRTTKNRPKTAGTPHTPGRPTPTRSSATTTDLFHSEHLPLPVSAGAASALSSGQALVTSNAASR